MRSRWDDDSTTATPYTLSSQRLGGSLGCCSTLACCYILCCYVVPTIAFGLFVHYGKGYLENYQNNTYGNNYGDDDAGGGDDDDTAGWRVWLENEYHNIIADDDANNNTDDDDDDGSMIGNYFRQYKDQLFGDDDGTSNGTSDIASYIKESYYSVYSNFAGEATDDGYGYNDNDDYMDDAWNE
ncbi:expressed unknown protein [Seminavis robusta]|uniref:Uncharacterized protein n=1 Tax=Seminavis robusta TaxID=568900 RepID=A0A9N8E209_9STRA|nr:expressed unknown protein [Seminavis robusta]|eukprot:Sro478_g150920.1 n/a (183) ;mRNA; r:7195-7743